MDEALDRKTLLVVGVVILGTAMSILDATMINVALDTLARELRSPLPTVQWVISGYTFALASVIPLSGWAADRFGARRVWLFAVVVFTLGSVLGAVAWSPASLITSRVVQGMGGGLLNPIGITVMANAAGPQRMGKVMSLMGVPLLVGPVVGPVLGGLLLQVASWRWIFLINLPVGAAAVALGLRLLPRGNGRNRGRLDLVGLLLLSPGLAALIAGVSQIRSPRSLGSASVLGSLVVAALLIGVFVWRSLRTDAPLLDLRMFAHRTFAASSVTTFVLGVATFGAALLLPLYFQQVRGESPLMTGLLTTPQAAGMGIALMFANRLTNRVGAGRVVLVGLLMAAGGQLGLTQVDAATSYWRVGAALVLLGLGLGSSIMPSISAAYATLSPSAMAGATSEIQIVQRIGSTLGSALFAVVLAQEITAIGSAAAADPATLAGAYADAFWWAVIITGLALIPALLLPRQHTPSRLHGLCHPLAGNSRLEPKAS